MLNGRRRNGEKNIKGISIEIEGTRNLFKRLLKDVDSSASKASLEIKDIDNL
ncbi:hypothetical protein MU448_11480 [Streptococcus sp. O1]|nr:hypothetical protein [Streptococcus sp. O1]